MPPAVFFVTSGIFHYLGPALAVLLFAEVAPLGVAWLRIVFAAAVFALWRRPRRVWQGATPRQRWRLLALGGVLAGMNAAFYLALQLLPLAVVGAIEFLGVIALATAGARTRRNLLALALAVAGVAALSVLQFTGRPLGVILAFVNCAGFMAYVVLGHRIATTGAGTDATPGDPPRGIDQLAVAMLIAAAAITPFGVAQAVPAFAHPLWLAWGAGVAVCSSVIPYVSDQLAMARLPRATFALMLALLPVSATVMGLVALRQIPTWRDMVGIGLVVAGIAVHRDPA